MPDFLYSSYFGVYVRADTSPEIVRKLNSALNTITATPEVIAMFQKQSAGAVQT